MEAFWTVWNPARSAPTVRHDSREEALREAERLASIQPNDSFYVMQAITVSRKVTVTTHELTAYPPF